MDEILKHSRWHVGKEIPLSLVLGLVIQTAVLAGWAQGVSSKVDKAIESLAEFRQERYTQGDARRDFTSLQIRDVEHDRRLSDLERRLERIEAEALRGKR